jgi:hypothetical protein
MRAPVEQIDLPAWEDLRKEPTAPRGPNREQRGGEVPGIARLCSLLPPAVWPILLPNEGGRLAAAS